MKYFIWFVSILCLNYQQVIAQNVEDRLVKSMHLVMDVYHSPTESIDQRIHRAANDFNNLFCRVVAVIHNNKLGDFVLKDPIIEEFNAKKQLNNSEDEMLKNIKKYE